MTVYETEHLGNKLLLWYRENRRELPWRDTCDPYRIWVSEIILQQTRVVQGAAYYHRFIERFPNIESLASAREEEVLKLWEGLGYYSRARNLHHASKQIMENFQGTFPQAYNDILSLKGVGEYTAGAIASFAFNKAYPAIDGNVYRVLSRLFGISSPIDTGTGKKEFYKLTASIQCKSEPGDFNQALIEFGALHCKVQNPLCRSCIFESRCIAYQANKISFYPQKKGKVKVQKLYLYYFVVKTPQGLLLQQRKKKGIWQNMFEFPCIESSCALTQAEQFEQADFLPSKVHIQSHTGPVTHLLTHRKIEANFLLLNCEDAIEGNYTLIQDKRDLEDYALPRLLIQYIQSQEQNLFIS